jgi:hypothetical protein
MDRGFFLEMKENGRSVHGRHAVLNRCNVPVWQTMERGKASAASSPHHGTSQYSHPLLCSEVLGLDAAPRRSR